MLVFPTGEASGRLPVASNVFEAATFDPAVAHDAPMGLASRTACGNVMQRTMAPGFVCLLILAACGGGKNVPGRSAPTPNPPWPAGSFRDPGGPVPALSPDAFGGALPETAVDAAFAAITARLQSMARSLPATPEARAAVLVAELPKLENVRWAVETPDHSVTVQLTDGTPLVLLTTALAPATARVDTGATDFANQAPAAQVPPESGARQAAAGACTAETPSPGDERLPSGDRAVLVEVSSLGGGARTTLSSALRKKGYNVVSSVGALSDLRTMVRDIDVLWMASHGAEVGVRLGPGENDPRMVLFALVGDVSPDRCADAPDCADNRADLQQTRLVRVQEHTGGPHYWAITRAFISHYWKLRPQSLVYLDGCSTANAESFVVEFRNDLKLMAHAGTFLGWDGFSTALAGGETAALFFDGVAGANVGHAAPVPKQRPFNAGRMFQWMSDTGRAVDGIEGGHLRYEQWSGTPFALAPSIRTLKVDEGKSELRLRGDFGPDQGSVSIAQHDVPVKSWGPHDVVVALPVSGAGSSGAVVASVRGHPSNAVPLSSWEGTLKQTSLTTSLWGGSPGMTSIVTCSLLHFRDDAHAYRCEPSGELVRGPAGDGRVVPVAAGNTACRWDISGSGIAVEGIFVTTTTLTGPFGGTLPPVNQDLPPPAGDNLFALAEIETGNTLALTDAKVRFFMLASAMYGYHSSTVLMPGNLPGGTFDGRESIVGMNPLMGPAWYPMTPALALPRATGVALSPPAVGDTATVDYELPVVGGETADTEH